jgi:hypothetical protein
MDELLFIGVPIRKETRVILDGVTEQVCAGMTDSEKKAYEMGIENTLRAMESLLECDDEPKLYMSDLEISTEMTLDKVKEYFGKQ